MATTLSDIHPDIIKTHILPRLDGPSLSTTATASTHLNALCSDDALWSQISRTTWPSITHPRLDNIISTFPSGHRSFFDDSFPALITDVNHHSPRQSTRSDCSPCDPDPDLDLELSSRTWPSEIVSAFDLRYQNDVVYSGVKFTQITNDFLTSAFRIELNSDPNSNRSGSEEAIGISRTIDLTVDEIAGADKPTLSHLKESLTLNWILIDPTRKRACNISSIKPVGARQDWVGNETVLRYVTVLPGSDPNEIVQCRIQVVLGVGEKGVGLYVKEVVLKLQDLDSMCLNGMEFLMVTEGAIMAENRVRRKVVVDDEERWKSYRVYKEMKREKIEWDRKMERKKELVLYFNYVAIFVSFFFCVYFFILLIS